MNHSRQQTPNSSNIALKLKTSKKMKNAHFWDVRPCGSCEERRFGERIDFIVVKRIG
jgi:hypothetical protein